ncbi:MAG: hypothetical protein SCG84_06330, partial [Nitrosomonadaceae bacterium]|nr:hypothetical protein [Nitrosomonadaceae bacterium]MDW7619477.1 hypothetical protein [Nitrosomonadaceae bacterium]MDW7666714.1 hypothetical protein [Nitrosomonadaceae bacterium]
PHKFLRISSFGSPVALPFVSFGTPSGHYDDRTDVALQNRTDHELSTQAIIGNSSKILTCLAKESV